MPNYTTPYYTSDYYTLTSWPVVLDGLVQSGLLSSADVERTVGLLLHGSHQTQALAASSVEAHIAIATASLIQNQTLSPSALTFTLGVVIDALRQGQTLDAMDLSRVVAIGIDHSGQVQTLHGMGVGLELIVTLMDLVQTQELLEALISITAGRCFCISLSESESIHISEVFNDKIFVTFSTNIKILEGVLRYTTPRYTWNYYTQVETQFKGIELGFTPETIDIIFTPHTCGA